MFDVECLSVCEVETAASISYKQRVQGQFLRGPIPLQDLATAAALPGQALWVFLLVHYRVAITKKNATTLSKQLLDQHGVSRDSKSRALRALENAALISVDRGRGRTARIMLARVPAWASRT